MKIRVSVLLNVVLVIALSSSILFSAITAETGSRSGYDPWLDYDDDGDIDFDDVVPMAMSYGTSGDPIKNVNVANWPTSTDVTVWWNVYLTYSDFRYSPTYNASGFGHLHVLARSSGLSGPQKITVYISGKLWNADHTDYRAILAYSFDLTETYWFRDITIPVPSETFFFQVMTGAESYGYIFLSFYLTWA